MHKSSEIRELFEMIQKRVTSIDSNLGNLLIPKCEVNGFCTENKSCGRKPMVSTVMGLFESHRKQFGEKVND